MSSKLETAISDFFTDTWEVTIEIKICNLVLPPKAKGISEKFGVATAQACVTYYILKNSPDAHFRSCLNLYTELKFI